MATTYILTATPEVANWLTTKGPDGSIAGLGTDLGEGRVRLTQNQLDNLKDLPDSYDGTVDTSGDGWTLYEDGSAWPIARES